jgi:SpoVK/Ycf46/Vps4 family AAA+-type ATPase
MGWSIIKINISSLLGSNTEDGNTDSRIEILLRELKERTNTILFIDEVHLLVNRTSNNTNMDFANVLKPYLDRGTIKMIGATTTEEYETYILRDRAFVRRFQKIDIKEADAATVVKILMGTYPKFEKKLNVKMAYTDFQKEQIFKFLVDMTSEYKRVYEMSSRYPDITLTILASAFSYAVFENSKEVRIKHVYEAIRNAKSIYPDALTKEIVKFKETFKEMLEDENVDLTA